MRRFLEGNLNNRHIRSLECMHTENRMLCVLFVGEKNKIAIKTQIPYCDTQEREFKSQIHKDDYIGMIIHNMLIMQIITLCDGVINLSKYFFQDNTKDLFQPFLI